VLKKLGLLIGVAACGALVTSCGGDDTPDPAPTATGTATPTPTPSAAVVFDLTAGFEATSNNANGIAAFFTPTGGVETFNDASRLNGPSTIALAFNPETARFQFPDQADAETFSGADFVSGSATQRVYADGNRMLTLQVPFSQSLRVTYELDNQPFTRDSTAGTLRSERTALFFNTVTTTDDITTTLTYTGDWDATGGEPGTTPPGAISIPQTTFTVTPGTDDKVTGTVQVFQTINNVSTKVAEFAIDATVSASGGFSGTVDDTVFDLKGSYAGTLAGPNREELVIVFNIANTDDAREYQGSYIGD
jgi:hypothetical protein